jgi:SH3-like domain-containing protein
VSRILLTLLILALGTLACTQPVPNAPSATPTPTATPVPTATVTMFPAAEDVNTAIVRQVSVNVRNAPDGDPTGEYVYAGQSVTVLEVVKDEQGDEWAKIADPAGYVYAGCLEGINDKGCEAK